MDVGAVNETLAEMNAEPVLDTGRHIRTDVGRDTWQAKVDAKVVVWQTN